MIELVLGVETSCDDTSAAVVDRRGRVLSVASANQNQAHRPFGGVVPEIASRNHVANLLPLIDRAVRESGREWTDVGGIAVTAEPGLIGSLLVGLVTAKTLAMAKNLPFIGVNHLEGHLLAPFLSDESYRPPAHFDYPFVALAISGGHTSLYRCDALGAYEVLGRTMDDAAGEAFDKFAKMVGLGFPGGPRVDRAARGGRADRFAFPRAMLKESHYNFSFSGLKAAAIRLLESFSAADRATLAREAEAVARGSVGEPPGLLADLCASFQAAAIDALLERLSRAAREEGVARAALTGGVSANAALRERALAWAADAGVELAIPPLRYCTDNAAMIAFAGALRLNAGERSALDLSPSPRAPLGRLRPGAEGPRLASARGK